jgi:Tfp pilus assembly protein PilW
MIQNKLTSSSANKNKGFTLIELLVSMVTGIVLIAGLLSMYMGSRETDKSRTELSEIEANAREALNTLRQTIQHAGYTSIEGIALDKPFLTPVDGELNTNNPNCIDEEPMIVSDGLLNPPTELTGYTNDFATGDIITVIYRPDHPDQGNVFSDCASGNYAKPSFSAADIKDRQKACSTDRAHSEVIGDTAEGMDASEEPKIYSGIYLRTFADGRKQLSCFGSRSESVQPRVIADNIDNIQILYGVLIDGNTSYKNATAIEASGDWESVTSVQIAILVRSSGTEVLKNAQDRTYRLLDKVIAKLSTDHRLYKVYSTTINLPNRSQSL